MHTDDTPQPPTEFPPEVVQQIRDWIREGSERWAQMSREERLLSLLRASRWTLVQEAYRDKAIDELVSAIDRELAAPPALPFDVMERLHGILTCYGIASRSLTDGMDGLPSDLVAWAADACRQSLPRLTSSDIDQIVEGIEHFCIGPQDTPELDAIWRPYIDKLKGLRAAFESRR